jgi:TnpA family transposase
LKIQRCVGGPPPVLNKGEARNSLARAVFFNRLGEIRDRSFENQRHRASGLNLVVAAITLWNTVYLECATEQMAKSWQFDPPCSATFL